MKLLLFLTAFVVLVSCNDSKNTLEVEPSSIEPLRKFLEGDIIFQTSLSSQSNAIQVATKSKYSHMGIIFKKGTDFFVFEAVQPVKYTPLDKWIKRGERGHYVVKRLKDAGKILTGEVLDKMKRQSEKYSGADYDIYFEWTDDKIYCSELVWKIYKESAGVEVGELETLKDFDLSDEVVRKKLAERFGENIPMEETVISPAGIFNSDKLVTIAEN